MSQRFTGNFPALSSVTLVTSGPHTVCAWVYLSSSSGAADIFYSQASPDFLASAIWLGYDVGNFEFYDKLGGVGYEYTQAVTTSAWTHLALTYDGTSCRSYVNGALVNGPTATTLGTRGNHNDADIGSNGDMTAQDVMIFNVALSASQIAEAMRLSLPVGVSAYAWFKLTNAAPTTDSSGNGHTLASGGNSNGVQILISATGNTSATGAATFSAPTLVATGTTNATGAAAVTKAAGLVGAGTTNTTGAVTSAAAAALVAAGTTRTTGSAVVTSVTTAAGSTQSTGSAVVTSAAALVAAGTTQTTGSAATASGIVAAGSTQTTGAAAVTSASALAASGTAQTTGAASATSAASIASAGTTRTTGAVTMTSAASIAATGTTRTTGAANSGRFPLTISANHHYLQDAGGQPFFINEASSWGLIQCMSLASAKDYIDKRIADGFNAMKISVISNDHTFVGDYPFAAPAWNSIAPFSTFGNFSTYNSAYFDHAIDVLDYCLAKGLLVFLVSNYMGVGGGEGWGDAMAADTNAHCLTYGTMLGTRFGGYPNIIWCAGGDHSPDSTLAARQVNVVNGIRSVDPGHFWTSHWDNGDSIGGSLSTDVVSVSQAQGTVINGLYCFDPANPPFMYTRIREGYESDYTSELGVATVPVFVLDSPYETEPQGTPVELRSKSHQEMCEGACGIGFNAGPNWYKFIDWTTPTQGTTEATYAGLFWASQPWSSMAPDATAVYATSGRGTFNTSTYVSVLASPTNLVAAYPSGAASSIVIDLSKFSSSIRARWWDPSANTYSSASFYSNTGTHTFANPGTNAAGDSDWLLVLEATGSLVAAGTTNTTGSAAVTSAAALVAAGTTRTTGAATLAAAAALLGAGTTQSTGAATLTVAAALVAAGSVQTTGAATATVSATLAATGTTNTTGAASVSSSGGGGTSITGSGSTQTTGAATLGIGFAVAGTGTTQSTGASSLTAAAPIAGTGTTQTTGAADVGWSTGIAASSTTRTTGAADVVASAPLFSVGSTSTTGVATMLVSYTITATGTTYSTGSAVASGGIPVISTGGPGKQTGSVRRFSESAAMRRPIRR